MAVCSGHGICDDGTLGYGTCSCENGYEGDLCDRCLADILENCTVGKWPCKTAIKLVIFI